MTGRPISPAIARDHRDPRQIINPDGSVHALVEVIGADDTVQLHLNVKSSLRERLRVAAETRGISMTALAAELLDSLPPAT